ncbi:hypothetical protein GQ54DRAFT_177699 [Martensiomyces pterosporus]|nr:hypothetical protein GQ54DRAFT_177699 [Martensiomyces pterosporus]
MQFTHTRRIAASTTQFYAQQNAYSAERRLLFIALFTERMEFSIRILSWLTIGRLTATMFAALCFSHVVVSGSLFLFGCNVV